MAYKDIEVCRRKTREYGRKMTFIHHLLIKQMKASSPCMDCGNFYHYAAMDFDHVRGEKVRNISMMYGRSIQTKTLLDEVRKCDLVCANCHRIRTFNRQRLGKGKYTLDAFTTVPEQPKHKHLSLD